MSFLHSLAVLAVLVLLALLAADVHRTMILVGGIVGLLLVAWSRQATRWQRAGTRRALRAGGR